MNYLKKYWYIGIIVIIAAVFIVATKNSPSIQPQPPIAANPPQVTNTPTTTNTDQQGKIRPKVAVEDTGNGWFQYINEIAGIMFKFQNVDGQYRHFGSGNEFGLEYVPKQGNQLRILPQELEYTYKDLNEYINTPGRCTMDFQSGKELISIAKGKNQYDVSYYVVVCSIYSPDSNKDVNITSYYIENTEADRKYVYVSIGGGEQNPIKDRLQEILDSFRFAPAVKAD